MVASTLTLTAIAADRFFGIVFAIKARVSPRRSGVIVACVWIVAVMVATPLLLVRAEERRIWLNHVEIWCEDTWPSSTHFNTNLKMMVKTYPLKRAYYTTVSIVLFFVPMLVMLGAYLLIIRKLKLSEPPGEIITTNRHVQHNNKKKVIYMLSTLVSVFFLCWFPYQVVIFYAEYKPPQDFSHPSWYVPFVYFSKFLAHSNSAWNPVIYTCFNQTFRTGFRQAFAPQLRHTAASTSRNGAAANRVSSHTTESCFYELRPTSTAGNNCVTPSHQTYTAQPSPKVYRFSNI